MQVVTVDLEGLDSSKAPKTRFLIVSSRDGV